VEKMNPKIDFKKSMKAFYNPSVRGLHLVDVPLMRFLMGDGRGDPNTSEDYKLVLEALYTISYGIKFSFKSDGFDHVVPPLEGLWWMENMDDFTLANKGRWEWTMMIMQPEWVTEQAFLKARETAYKKTGNPSISKIRFETYHEGLSLQVQYTGAYQDETATLIEMHSFISDNGYVRNGKHHEIYLSDPRKTAVGKLKTILRQPILKR
jgi:hypothetical protein